MSSVENIRDNVVQAVEMLPSHQLAGVEEELTRAQEMVCNVDGDSGLLHEVASHVGVAIAHVQGVQELFRTGEERLGSYLQDIGLGTSPEDSGNIKSHPIIQSTQVNQSNLPAEAGMAPSYANVQRVPASWDSLLGLSSNLLTAGTDPVKAALTLRDAYKKLSAQEVEEVRYYALSELATRVAPQLCDPAVHAALAEQGSRLIVDNHASFNNYFSKLLYGRDTRGEGIHVCEIDGDVLYPIVKPIVAQAAAELPSDVLQLGDTISSYSLDVSIKRKFGDFKIFENPPGITDEDPLKGSGHLASGLGQNLWSGASVLWKRALLLHTSTYFREKLMRTRLPSPNDCLLIRDITSIDNLHTINIRQAAHAAAALHREEFDTFVARHTSIKNGFKRDDNGKIELTRAIRLNNKQIPRIPERMRPIMYPDALHDARIGCPALYVRNLIPAVLDLIPPIIQKADKEVRQHRDLRPLS